MNMYKLWQKARRFVVYGGIAVAATTMSPVVFEELKSSEGTRNTAYLDSVGVPTIGVGHTNATGMNSFKMGDVWTDEQVNKALTDDTQLFWDGIGKQVTVDLTQCQQSVLTSWAYNVGLTASGKSTLVRKLNTGDYASVPAQLKRWDKAGGKKLRGLTLRRAREAKLWETGCKV